MLKRENRLTKISSVFQKKVSTPLFTLKTGKNNLELSRFAFVISKKVDSRATVRNKTKRKIRAIIEETLSTIPKGKDFAFYLKKESVGADSGEIRNTLNKIFKND